jgi:hypothetical protein
MHKENQYSNKINQFSLSRPSGSEPWKDHVQWVQGDVSAPAPPELLEAVRGACGAVTCVGGFGNNEVSNIRYSCLAWPFTLYITEAIFF